MFKKSLRKHDNRGAAAGVLSDEKLPYCWR